MSLKEENVKLRMRLNALKEQNDRLIGTVKVLEATNEQLTLKNESLEKLYKEFKDAFEDVFIRNVSDSWARVDDETKKRMKTQDKIYFFNREVNNTKIAIRDYLLDKLKAVEKAKNEEIERLTQRIAELEQSISSKEQRSYDDSVESTDIQNQSDDWKNKQSTKSNSEVNPDNKEDREAHKKSFSTKDGSSVFGDVVFNKKNANKQSVVENKVMSVTEEEEKIHLERVYPTFKEISKERAIHENMKYVRVQEKISVMTKAEVDKKFDPIQIKLSKMLDERRAFALALVKIVGSTGLYTIKDIEEEISKRLSNTSFNADHQTLEKLSSANMVRQNIEFLCEIGFMEKLETPIAGGRGRPSYPYVLSESGQWAYAGIEKDDPVKSLYLTMAKDQKSAEHATNIKKVLDILEKNNYVCTQEDRIDIPDGRSSICDILAQKNGQQFRIEVEDGNYPKDKYFEKYEKILRVDNWLIFISPNVDTRDKIRQYFFDFIQKKIYNGMDGFTAAGKKYIFLSITELQDNPDIFYNKMVIDD